MSMPLKGPILSSLVLALLGWESTSEAAVQCQRTLVANGNDDIMTPTYASYAMFQAIPDARLALYPDSGHGFLFQYPEEFADDVQEFLRAP